MNACFSLFIFQKKSCQSFDMNYGTHSVQIRFEILEVWTQNVYFIKDWFNLGFVWTIGTVSGTGSGTEGQRSWSDLGQCLPSCPIVASSWNRSSKPGPVRQKLHQLGPPRP